MNGLNHTTKATRVDEAALAIEAQAYLGGIDWNAVEQARQDEEVPEPAAAVLGGAGARVADDRQRRGRGDGARGLRRAAAAVLDLRETRHTARRRTMRISMRDSFERFDERDSGSCRRQREYDERMRELPRSTG